MQILPIITVGQAVERKLLLIGFSEERRVISVDIEKSETRLVGLIGHIDHGAKGSKLSAVFVMFLIALIC